MSDLMQEIREGAGFGLIAWAWDWWGDVSENHDLPNSVSDTVAVAIFMVLILAAFTPVSLLWILAMALRVPYDFVVWAMNRREGRSKCQGN